MTAPRITTVYGKELPSRFRAAVTKQKHPTTLQIQVVDDIGNPVDLTSLGAQPVKAKFREVINVTAAESGVASVDGGFYSAPDGVLTVDVPTNLLKTPGIYYVQIGVLNDDEDPIYSSTIFLYVEPGLFGGALTRVMFPLPTIQEVQLRMRDSGPEENLLLRNYEYDVAEICDALIWCVNTWNTVQPPIDLFYNTTNYPLYHPDGYASYLLETAATRYMRNHLPYQAAGVSVDDQNKFQVYLGYSAKLRETYIDLVKHKKTCINAEMAFSSMGSGYGWFRPY